MIPDPKDDPVMKMYQNELDIQPNLLGASSRRQTSKKIICLIWVVGLAWALPITDSILCRSLILLLIVLTCIEGFHSSFKEGADIGTTSALLVSLKVVDYVREQERQKK